MSSDVILKMLRGAARWRVLAGLGAAVVVSSAGSELHAGGEVPCSPSEEAQFVADAPVAADRLGGSVSMDGEFAIVGVSGADYAEDAGGAAIVYRLDGDVWVKEATLTAPDSSHGDNFGSAVAIVSDPDGVLGGAFAVVGAFRDDDNGAQSGSAYVFRRHSDKTWFLESKLLASDGGPTDFYGYSVSACASPGGEQFVVVGAYVNDHAGSGSGSAYVYRRTILSWAEDAVLHASDAEASDRFGIHVDIDCTDSEVLAIVGADGESTRGTGAGAAYVFSKGQSSWSEDAKILAGDTSQLDRFGFDVAVALDPADGAHRLAVGAHLNALDGGSSMGSAYVFTFDPGDDAWLESASFVGSDSVLNDFFGYTIDLDRIDDGAGVPIAWVLASGAVLQDAAGQSSGAAYIFRSEHDSPTIWIEQSKVIASDGGPNDQYGGAVHVSSRRSGSRKAIVGAPEFSDGVTAMGSAYVIDLNCADVDACVEDIANGDAVVNVDDLLLLLSSWGACADPCAADLNDDGAVDVNDLLQMLSAWGDCA